MINRALKESDSALYYFTELSSLYFQQKLDMPRTMFGNWSRCKEHRKKFARKRVSKNWYRYRMSIAFGFKSVEARCKTAAANSVLKRWLQFVRKREIALPTKGCQRSILLEGVVLHCLCRRDRQKCHVIYHRNGNLTSGC